MARFAFCRVLSCALIVGGLLPVLIGGQVVGAAALHQSSPPTSIDPIRSAVSGTLVAKPVSGEGNIPAVCRDRDENAVRAAVSQNRGLVVCTEEGKLVLLQLSARTRYFNRDWRRIVIAQMKDGDHINAWGTLRDNGHLLSPTSVVQDASITTPPPPKRVTVSGTLVAKPINGEANIPPACRDRDAATVGQAAAQNRGLVICTEEGRLILLQLSASTRIVARNGGPMSVALLTDGDHLIATGSLKDNGYLLDPTNRVEDADVQAALTESQDFIAQGGTDLTLYVLKSEAGGPVQGIVHAVPGGKTRVVLCGGRVGSWSDLTQGKTVDIARSLFNVRTMTYIDTDTVRVVSCR